MSAPTQSRDQRDASSPEPATAALILADALDGIAGELLASVGRRTGTFRPGIKEAARDLSARARQLRNT